MIDCDELAQCITKRVYTCDVDAEIKHTIKRIAVVLARKALDTRAKETAKDHVDPGLLGELRVDLPMAMFNLGAKRW